MQLKKLINHLNNIFSVLLMENYFYQNMHSSALLKKRS